ncbi:MAG: hypothetical protein AAGI53_09560 [Planctomycetota bacterium]
MDVPLSQIDDAIAAQIRAVIYGATHKTEGLAFAVERVMFEGATYAEAASGRGLGASTVRMALPRVRLAVQGYMTQAGLICPEAIGGETAEMGAA